MPFKFDLRHWPTVADFATHLNAHAPSIASWAQGAIIHHTVVPVQSAWAGAATMQGIKNFYETSNGWDAGPHLFIVAGSPNAANDGIWQVTPLNLVGIHAGVCNSSYWGIEVVGNYDQTPWDAATRTLVVGAVGELLRWRGVAVSATSIKGHRDCNSPKTCPGTSIDLANVRTWVSTYLTPPAPPAVPITKDATWVADPRCTMAQAIAHIQARKVATAFTSADISMHIVPTYWDVATTVDLDPCVVLAHMMLASDRM